ncbi:replication family protein [Staphylococcus aureus]|nr:replication family protein [Staphylococcus aureus]
MLSYGGLLKQKHKILNLDDAEDGNLINTSDEDKTTDEEKKHIQLPQFGISKSKIMVLHQMWWVYNLKNYFKLQLLEFLLLGGQSIIGLGCLLFFSFV